MELTVNEWKELFFEQLVSTERVRYDKQRNSKSCDTHIEILNPALNIKVNSLWLKLKTQYNNNRNEFLSDAIWTIWNAIEKFNIKDGGNWHDIVNGTDKANIGRLITLVKTHLTHELRRIKNDAIESTKTVTTEDGAKRVIHTHTTVKYQSIEALMFGNNQEEKHEILTATNSYWNCNDKANTHENAFKTWFNNNRERILTTSQNELIDRMEAVNYWEFKEEFTEEDVRHYLGIAKRDVRLKVNRIIKRVTETWEAERKFFEKPYVIIRLEKQLNLVHTILNTADDNKAFSNAIRSNIDASVIESIVYDKLTLEHSKAVISAVVNKTDIPTSTLYRIYAELSNTIERLELAILKEQAIFESAIKNSKVTVPIDYVKAPESGSVVYLTLNSDGVLLPSE